VVSRDNGNGNNGLRTAPKQGRSPLTWFGGKGNFLAKLLPLVPPHTSYCEPFAGAAALFFAKAPAPIETLNDLNGDLIHFYKVLRDPTLYPELQRRLELTLYSRQEYYEARATWREIADPVERAARWFVVNRMSFGGRFGSGWGYGTHDIVGGGYVGQSRTWLFAIDNVLPAAHARLRQAQIECADWRKVLVAHDGPNCFFYCDPPYVLGTRRAGGYAHEMTDDDHCEFVAVLQTLAGMVLVSGYAHPIYDPLVTAGWERLDYETGCFAAGRTRASGLIGTGAALRDQSRTETLWLNPALQKALGRGRQLTLPGVE